MDRIWADAPVDVKTVHRAIGAKRGITLNTVQSTMERLHRKGLLRREKVSHAYVYSPRVSRAELATRLVSDIVSAVAGSDGEPLLAAFVSMVERAGDGQLDRLERMIRDRRNRKEPSR